MNEESNMTGHHKTPAISNKHYLAIRIDEQTQRLADGRRHRLNPCKISPIDAVALKHWDDYSAALDATLLGSHTDSALWQVLRTDRLRHARLNLMRENLGRLHYAGRSKRLIAPDRNVVFEFTTECLTTHRLAS